MISHLLNEDDDDVYDITIYQTIIIIFRRKSSIHNDNNISLSKKVQKIKKSVDREGKIKVKSS